MTLGAGAERTAPHRENDSAGTGQATWLVPRGGASQLRVSAGITPASLSTVPPELELSGRSTIAPDAGGREPPIDDVAPGSISAMSQPPTERTRVRRHPERADYDLGTVRAVLDEALLCTASWVDGDGRVRALPTIQARIDDTLYLHGSRAARAWKAVAAGAEVCVVATVVDELVLARTSPAHSMNYRSAVVFGTPSEVTDRDELLAAARAITRHVLPGRENDAAEPDEDDWRQTLILAMPIAEASAKVRVGPPIDDEHDLELDAWAGTLPLRLVAGCAHPAPDLRAGIEVPAYIPSSGEELPRP